MTKRIVTFHWKSTYQGLGKWAVFSFDCTSRCDRKRRSVSQIPILQISLFFRLDAPAVSRSQGRSLIGPRLGLINIIQYSWNFFTSIILKWSLILHGSYTLLPLNKCRFRYLFQENYTIYHNIFFVIKNYLLKLKIIKKESKIVFV